MSKVSDLSDTATALERSLASEGDSINNYLRDDIEVAISAMREAVSSIHEAGPASPSLVKSYIDMWQGECDDFDAKYGKHIIGTEYELGNCDTRREETTECRIGVLREILPVLRAAHPAPISKGVTVKALEWEDEEHEAGFDIVARTTFGNYVINRDAISSGGAWNLWMAGETNDDISTCYDNLADAKAAAQSDFETRIRSCLSHTAGEIE